MKIWMILLVIVMACGGEARTIHRSFRNGYPVLPGINTVPEQPDSFCIKSAPPSRSNVIVVTNRVVVAGVGKGGVVKGGTAKKPKARPATTTTKTSVRGANGGVKGGAVTVKPVGR